MKNIQKKYRELPAEDQVRIIARVAADQKALDVVALDVRGLASFADYFVIMGGTSTRHVQGLADVIDREISSKRAKATETEGLSEGQWILLDYGDVIVHIFYHETRPEFDLEGLWHDAPRLDLSKPAPVVKEAAGKKRKVAVRVPARLFGEDPDAVAPKATRKPKPKAAAKAAAKPPRKVAAKPARKTTTKAAAKPARKTTTKPARKAADRSTGWAEERPARKTAERPTRRTSEKPAVKAADKPTRWTAEKPARKTTERSARWTADKPARKSADRSDSWTAEKPTRKSVGKPTRKAPTAKPQGKPAGRTKK